MNDKAPQPHQRPTSRDVHLGEAGSKGQVLVSSDPAKALGTPRPTSAKPKK